MFIVFLSASICCIYFNCYLLTVAHDQKVTERNSDMQRIAVNLSLAGDSSEKGKFIL